MVLTGRVVVSAAVALCLSCGSGEEAAPRLPADFPAAFEEVRGCRSSTEHFPRVRILAPAAVASLYDRGPYPFPAGTVIVKEEFGGSACADLTGYTLMRKGEAGSDPGGGGWSYERLDATGRRETREPAARCASCHAACKARDFMCAD